MTRLGRGMRMDSERWNELIRKLIPKKKELLLRNKERHRRANYGVKGPI